MEPPDYKRAQHPGQEMLFVVKGRVKVAFPHDSVKLAAGDCIVFSGQLPHCVLSLRPQRAEALVINKYGVRVKLNLLVYYVFLWWPSI